MKYINKNSFLLEKKEIKIKIYFKLLQIKIAKRFFFIRILMEMSFQFQTCNMQRKIILKARATSSTLYGQLRVKSQKTLNSPL